VDGKLQARLPGFLWNGRAQAVLNKFEQATGAHLASGLKVMLQLSAEFSATYGVRAVIEDIDPAYTLGDIAAKLKAIRDALIEAGVFDLNKVLPSPSEFCQVAVISPKEAAGLGDFRQDADRLEAAGICHFTYYTATFQGEDAPRSLLSAITDLRSDVDAGQDYDAVCVIRGGGSVTDLYWLNDHALADALCRLSIPVFTGIGHERDNTILDEVAHQRFDTPSKVIGYISGTVYANANQAIEYLLLLLKAAGNILAIHEHQVERLRVEIQSNAKTQLLTTEHELERQWALIQSDSLGVIRDTEFELIRLLDLVQQTADQQISSTHQALDQLMSLISHFGHQRLSEMELSIEGLAREILGVGPKATLSRGFLLARDAQGHPITSADKARATQQFDLEFHDGKVSVKVTDPSQRKPS
jgi:exodeoxyribonuclease VII large subunit